MYNNIGLATARGSGTNGYVQRNIAAVPKRRQNMSWEASMEAEEKRKNHKPKQYVADKDILEHERKKKIEIELLEWADSTGLLDSEKSQEEIDEIMDKKRQSIIENQNRRSSYGRREEPTIPSSSHSERHQKEAHQHKLASALRIRDDYVEGQAFDRDYQIQEREARAQKKLELERLRKEEAKILKQLEEKRRLTQKTPAGSDSVERVTSDADVKSDESGSDRSDSPIRSTLQRKRSSHSDESSGEDDSPKTARRTHDESPPRRGRDLPDDSPPRRERDIHDDSPPRRGRDLPDDSPPRRSKRPREDDLSQDEGPSSTAGRRSTSSSPPDSPPRSKKSKHND